MKLRHQIRPHAHTWSAAIVLRYSIGSDCLSCIVILYADTVFMSDDNNAFKWHQNVWMHVVYTLIYYARKGKGAGGVVEYIKSWRTRRNELQYPFDVWFVLIVSPVPLRVSNARALRTRQQYSIDDYVTWPVTDHSWESIFRVADMPATDTTSEHVLSIHCIVGWLLLSQRTFSGRVNFMFGEGKKNGNSFTGDSVPRGWLVYSWIAAFAVECEDS